MNIFNKSCQSHGFFRLEILKYIKEKKHGKKNSTHETLQDVAEALKKSTLASKKKKKQILSY